MTANEEAGMAHPPRAYQRMLSGRRLDLARAVRFPPLRDDARVGRDAAGASADSVWATTASGDRRSNANESHKILNFKCL